MKLRLVFLRIVNCGEDQMEYLCNDWNIHSIETHDRHHHCKDYVGSNCVEERWKEKVHCIKYCEIKSCEDKNIIKPVIDIHFSLIIHTKKHYVVHISLYLWRQTTSQQITNRTSKGIQFEGFIIEVTNAINTRICKRRGILF